MSSSAAPSVPLFGSCDEQGIPLVALPALRVAQENLAEIPPVSGSWSSFPPWCQEAIQKAMNEVFKVHSSESLRLDKALASLLAHRSHDTYPQVVLAAVPGVKNFHMDKSISSEDQQLLLQSMENTVRQARSRLLNTIIESKERALQAHRIQSSPAFALSTCRDRMFDSLVKMGFTMETLSPGDLKQATRALCHLRFNIDESLKRNAWTRVQAERQQAKRASAADAVMDTTSDLTPAVMTASIEKLIAQKVSASVSKLSKSLKGLSVSSSSSASSSRRSGSRAPRPSGSSGSRASGNKSSPSGKGPRPAGSRTPSGRVNKGASGPPRRLAPAPTPFKQLKGKSNNHKRG